MDSAQTEVEMKDAVAAVVATEPGASAVKPRRRNIWNPSAFASSSEVVPKPVIRALARMSSAAYVQGRLMDVLYSNRHARALGSCYSPGSNLISAVFLGQEARRRLADWEQITRVMVRHLLHRADRAPADPALEALVKELALVSPRFRRLWAEEAPASQVSALGYWHHPVVGQLRFTREKTPIKGTDGMMLVVFRPEVGSVSEFALELLRALPTDE